MRPNQRRIMFKNRKLTVSFDKQSKNATSENSYGTPEFEKKAEVILHRLESLGAKMFLGVCVYVMLDTHRQVAVERAKCS
jgi:hypothetical protein